MVPRQFRRLVLLSAGLVLLQSGVAAAEPQQPFDAAALIAAARNTQRATRMKLQVLGDAFTCPDARFVSYRRSDFEPQFVDHWYVASQLWADVALQAAVAPAGASEVRIDPPTDWDADDARCYMEKTDVFLDRQWDYAGGGFFPRSNATGTSVEAEVRFGDDNALTGLMLVDLAQNTVDPLRRQQYLHAARQQADFLMASGLWDSTFGGGFWWNTTHGASAEGKPAQTNALATLFFGRLYEATADEAYRSWMLRTLVWLDTILYDPAKHLYRWSASYQDLSKKTGAFIAERFVNYDQSIAIQAQVLAARVDGDANRLPRAVSLGEAVQSSFWVPERGYLLDSAGAQMYVSYGAWTSLGHVALYDATGDARWLEWARANLEALSGEPRSTDGGFGTQVFRCTGVLAQYCPPGETGWLVDHIRDGAAQAWVQQLQIALALRASPTDIR
jgi:hypothetical protein